MIQEIAPHQFDNEFSHRREPETEDLVLCYRAREALIREEGPEFFFPTVGELGAADPRKTEELIYLFAVDGQSYFLLQDPVELAGYRYVSIMDFRERQPEWRSFAGITGSQLYRWLLDNRYCGRCGAEMEFSDHERAFCCAGCDNTVYPKISPAVIVAVTDGDRILMSRYAGGNYRRYALLAGFAEIGETLEETVKREVMEEVGLKVRNIRYFGCQPWSFSDSLLVGFTAELDGSDAITRDETELAEACWFDRGNIPETSSLISLTSTMIEAFRSCEY